LQTSEYLRLHHNNFHTSGRNCLVFSDIDFLSPAGLKKTMAKKGALLAFPSFYFG
jgi:hypothetical protein